MRITPEQNLWQSVVTQAVRDAFYGDEYHRYRALSWFYRDSADYRNVCQMANVQSGRIRSAILETIFFNYFLKGDFFMNDLAQQPQKTLPQKFEYARRARSIFRAIYSQQELDKAIGSLTLQDIINICQQSEDELDAEAAWEAEND
jgi:hypothetical protein